MVGVVWETAGMVSMPTPHKVQRQRFKSGATLRIRAKGVGRAGTALRRLAQDAVGDPLRDVPFGIVHILTRMRYCHQGHLFRCSAGGSARDDNRIEIFVVAGTEKALRLLSALNVLLNVA